MVRRATRGGIIVRAILYEMAEHGVLAARPLGYNHGSSAQNHFTHPYMPGTSIARMAWMRGGDPPYEVVYCLRSSDGDKFVAISWLA